jgi:hypothetical protein
MCIDYTSLNKTCLKDVYPLPRICQIVDSTATCELLSFLGRVFGLSSNQPRQGRRRENTIHYAIRDFLLHQDGLRDEERGEGATYQKCVHIVLENHIGRNIEAYIDDIVAKSKKCGDLVDDLKETFDNLHKYKKMLNPKKYVFGVLSGKLLRYMVSSRRIDANPAKVEAIDKLQPPRT